MCGIAGAYGFSDRDVIKIMCDKLTHRGPDAEGYYLDFNVMLGMRRLKIIDINQGDQPIYNEDRSIVVVFNGEIYNYLEIRKVLINKGHVFTTNSDTETIIHLYEEFGDNFVNELRGMFAFALWDTKNKRLLISRDRIGIKPLYYSFNNGILSFASELKALLSFPAISKEINFDALSKYLTLSYIPAPFTIFNGINKLLPGHTLICENGKVDVKEYWDIYGKDYKTDGIIRCNEKDISYELLRLMKESVRMHLVSDVPLGTFLSGGLDSGAIVSLVSEMSSGTVKTFSVGFEDGYFNELSNAAKVATMYQTEHHELIVEPMDLDRIEDILSNFDEPFADSSAIPTYYVAEYAKQFVSVSLSGDGGDEIFCGYGNYKADKISKALRKIPLNLRTEGLKWLHRLSDYSDKPSRLEQAKKLLGTSMNSPEHGHVQWLHIINDQQKANLCKDERFNMGSNTDLTDEYFQQYSNVDFINQCMAVDIKTVLPDDYLTKVDRMSMANSLEVRVPFLDHKLIEFSAAIHSKYKLKGLSSKHLLKTVMKGRLPDDILNGRKKGFSVPLSKWFRSDLIEFTEKYLSKNTIEKRGYFNFDIVNQLIYEHKHSIKNNSKILWALICFEIWHSKWIDS